MLTTLICNSCPCWPLVAVPAYVAPDLVEPPAYTYQYGVNDDYSGANFQQTESRDGYATSGSYTVALPDGRVQTVNYADNGDGIVQDVTYEGVPQYGTVIVKTADEAMLKFTAASASANRNVKQNTAAADND